MILGFVGFLLVRVCVTLGCLSTPLCGMNDKKKLVIKALRAPSKMTEQKKNDGAIEGSNFKVSFLRLPLARAHDGHGG